MLGKVPSWASALATCSSILATMVPIIPTMASSTSTNLSTWKQVLSDGQWQSVAQQCGAPSSGPLSSHGPEAAVALGRGQSLLQAAPWGSASSAGPSQDTLPWPATPSTAPFNGTPCLFQAGSCAPPWAMCPCAVSSSGRSCAPTPNSKAKLGGIHAPTPARLWF